MENIDKKLNNLFSVKIPTGLHQSIMLRVNYQKIKPMLFIAFGILVFNFLLITWHINAKLIDADFLDMIQDFFGVFNFSFSFVGTITEKFFEIISPALFLSAFLSLVGSVYFAKKISSCY